jgi:iron-sulfur cluster repair protein YtfE (RIC family)
MNTSARLDFLGPIHKAIRCALADLLSQMGTTSFADAAASSRIAEMLEEVTALCEDHRDHEERFVLPVLAERLHGTLDRVIEAHGVQPVIVAELRALAETLRTSEPELRPVVGRTLYLHFTTFAAELLLHMAQEEQVLVPLIEKLFTDDEVRAMHGEVMGALTMVQRLRATPWMIRGTNAVERAAILEGVMQGVAR